MRMQSTVLPLRSVTVGKSSIFLPGQSSLFSPQIAATASQFVLFSGKTFFAPPLKYKTVFLSSVPFGPFSVSTGADAIRTTTALPLRSLAFRNLLGNISSRVGILISVSFQVQFMPALGSSAAHPPRSGVRSSPCARSRQSRHAGDGPREGEWPDRERSRRQ